MNCISCQAPLSMGFSKQEYWSGLPFPSLGESSWPRDQTQVSSIAGRFCTTWASREAQSVSQFSRSSKADSATPWTAACQASLSIINSWSLLKLMSIQSVMPSNHLILCCSLLLLPLIFPSIRVFSNESALCIRWPKYWSFSFNISPSNEHPGLISFKMDWLDLLADQGILKSLLQHHSSKASTLQCSSFFIVQLLHPYMTTGKTIALTRQIFVDKVMSLLFNMLSRLVITFLPRSKCLLISWLQSPSAVILVPRKIKSATVSTVSPSICYEVMGLKSWLTGKDSDAGRDRGQEEKGTTEDEMAGWHHGLDGRESEWTPGVGDGQGGLACCDSWGLKELDTTEWLNWTDMLSTRNPVQT